MIASPLSPSFMRGKRPSSRAIKQSYTSRARPKLSLAQLWSIFSSILLAQGAPHRGTIVPGKELPAGLCSLLRMHGTYFSYSAWHRIFHGG